MALLLLTQSLPAYTGTASVVAPRSRAATPTASFELNDLKALAAKQNPVLGYWDPLELASANFWDQSDAATIGFLRHAEIKHGRVAMAGFVGYIVHENGIHWPWELARGLDYSSFDGLSAPALWDALPVATKWQIIVFVGFLEIWSEADYVLQNDGTSHYMRGGKPGYFPTFDLVPHPVPLNLWDPFGKLKNYSEEKKARQLTIEVNNGRLAMIGLFGFLAEASVPGSVPGLTGLVRSFDGNIMSPDWYISTGAY